MSREILDHEKTAWLNYKGYCLARRMGNRGYASQETFLGDDYSRDLWATWMEWRREILAIRKLRGR